MNKSKKKKESNKNLAAVLIPAMATIIVALIGGIFGLATPLLLKNYETNSGDNGNISQATEDYSPHVTIDPEQMNFASSPVNGLYVSKGEISTGMLSWSANIDDNWFPAETPLCLINKGLPPSERRPLNLIAHSPAINVKVYWKGDGVITLTSYILIVDYHPLKSTIKNLEILSGGAGGDGSNAVFVEKTMPTLKIKLSSLKYDQEIDWINLKNNTGISFNMPLDLDQSGTYSFQVKFNIILSSGNNQPSQSRQVTLTTGEMGYTWVLINDPRNYPIDAGTYKVNMAPCP